MLPTGLNKITSIDAATVFRFHVEHRWRGASEFWC